MGSVSLVAAAAACAGQPTPGPPRPPGTTTSTTTASTSTSLPPEPVGSIERVTDSIGGEGGGESHGPSISGDGSRVAFWSSAWDLVPDDPNGVADIYMWEATGDATARLTNTRSGHQSTAPVISDEGRTVAFTSQAGDLVPDDLNGSSDVFVWDATSGTTTRITDGQSRAHGISADGRRVLFSAGVADLFVWDATTGTATRVTDGVAVLSAQISGDGRHVAYSAKQDTSSESDEVWNVFVWDAATGATTRITDGDADSGYPDVSADGRYVAFSSSASNLVPGETSEPGVFVWDATTGAVTRVTGGGVPRISGDGRYIAFSSAAPDLVPDDTNGVADVFVWDAATGTTTRITDGDGDSGAAVISADGSSIAFTSRASNLTDDDPDGVQDVFLWRRGN